MDLKKFVKICENNDTSEKVIRDYNDGKIENIEIVINEITNFQLNILNKLESNDFNKELYLSLLNEVEKYILKNINDVKISFFISRIYTKLISNPLIEKYPNYISENHFNDFFDLLMKNIDKKNFNKRIFSIYTIFVKNNISFGIYKIIDYLDYEYYENRLKEFNDDEDTSKYLLDSINLNDIKYFTNIRDMFIF